MVQSGVSSLAVDAQFNVRARVVFAAFVIACTGQTASFTFTELTHVTKTATVVTHAKQLECTVG